VEPAPTRASSAKLSHPPRRISSATPVGTGVDHSHTRDERSGLVTVELFSGQLMLRDPKDIEHYRDLFEFFAGNVVWAKRHWR
jgi:hypothetical protein